jgi:hypothetical protein
VSASPSHPVLHLGPIRFDLSWTNSACSLAETSHLFHSQTETTKQTTPHNMIIIYSFNASSCACWNHPFLFCSHHLLFARIHSLQFLQLSGIPRINSCNTNPSPSPHEVFPFSEAMRRVLRQVNCESVSRLQNLLIL